jgi:hypothetical protein
MGYFERVENGREFAFELHVDDGTDHLRDLSFVDGINGRAESCFS